MIAESPFQKKLNHLTVQGESCCIHVDLNIWQITRLGVTFFTIFTCDSYIPNHPSTGYLSKIHLHLSEMKELVHWLTNKLISANEDSPGFIYVLRNERYQMYFEYLLDQYDGSTFLIHVYKKHQHLFTTQNNLIWLIEWSNRMQVVVNNLE